MHSKFLLHAGINLMLCAIMMLQPIAPNLIGLVGKEIPGTGQETALQAEKTLNDTAPLTLLSGVSAQAISQFVQAESSLIAISQAFLNRLNGWRAFWDFFWESNHPFFQFSQQGNAALNSAGPDVSSRSPSATITDQYFVYLPLITSGGSVGTTIPEMTGLHLVLPAGWTYSTVEKPEQTGIADAEFLYLTSPDGQSKIEIRVDWHVLPPEKAFGTLELYPTSDYQERVVSYFDNIPIQVLEYKGESKEPVMALFAAFKAQQASYSISLQAPALDVPSAVFFDLIKNLTPAPGNLPASILSLGTQPDSSIPSGQTQPQPASISYVRSAVRSYAYTYGGLDSNSDGCYLWYDGSIVKCFWFGGAWGVDAAHYIRHAVSAGGMYIPDSPSQEGKNIGPLRSWLLSHGGNEVGSASQLMIGDVVFVGRNGCWGWGGVVHDVDGSGPLISTHSANHMNLRASQMTSNNCGATNMWSYVHMDATQDQPAPFITQSLTLNPSTPFMGQTVQATFQVCNTSQWGTFDTANLYVYSSSGVNFLSVDMPALGPGGCYSYNVAAAPFANSGQYITRAGYDNGGGFKVIDAASGKLNEVPVYVASLDEIQIQGEMLLTPEVIPQGGSANVQFQARNTGTHSLTDNFRVRMYGATYPNPSSFISEFATSGNITLAAGQSYSYNATQVLNTPGIYWIVGEHYSNGQWRPVAGNSQRSIRVTYPMPAPPRLAKGMPPYISFAGEPVNIATGNFYHEHTDLKAPQPGMDFEFTRYYNQLSANQAGPLGYGWTWSLALKVDWQADKTAILRYPDGREAYFFGELNPANPFDLSGDYVGQLADTNTLTRFADGTAQMVTIEQITYRFNQQGLLSQARDAQNNGFDIQRDASGYVLNVTHTSGDVYTFAYTNDYLTTVTLPNGETLQYSYSPAGDLTQSQGLDGNALSYVYDTQHRITEIHDGLGNRTLLNEYDSQNRVFRQTDASGKQTDFAYSGTTQTVFHDALNNPTTYTYNANLQVVQIEDSLGNITSFEYDADFNRTKRVDPEGGIWRWAYDARGRVTSSTNPLGATWTYLYDARGNLIEKREPLAGQITQYAYDANNNLTYIRDAEGCETFRQYNALGLLTQETQPGGMVTEYHYNAAGLQTQIIEHLDASTILTSSMTYDERGNRLSFTDAAGHSTTSTYDQYNQVTSTTDPSGMIVLFSYDANGNLTSETHGVGQTRYSTYDNQDRLLSYTDFAGHTWRLAYDAAGHVIQKTDPLGNYVAYTYDEAGNQVTYRDPLGKTWLYAYDGNGNRIRETDPLGNQIIYTYDLANGLLSTSLPCEACAGGRAVQTQEYYADGTLKSVTDGRGAKTTSGYDKTGRRTQIIDAQGNVTAFRYNLRGDLIETIDPLGHSILNTYNALGWLTSQTDRLGRVITFEYDAVGNRTKITDPRGFVTRHFYDAAGRLERALDALNSETLFRYDARGNLIETTNALLGITIFIYDVNNNLIQVTNPRGFSTFSTYDELGRRVRIQDAMGGISRFVYDAAGRNVSETNPAGYTRTWQYDDIGRLTRSTNWNATPTTFTYNLDGSRVSSTNPLGGITQRVFDANGNLTTETGPLGFTTFNTFDSLNHLTQVRNPLGSVWTYAFDALGRPTSATAPNGATTTNEYDFEGQILRSVDALAGVTQYQYDLSGNLIQKTDRNGHNNYYQYDALGQLVKQTNPLGFKASTVYNALGKPVQSTNFNGGATIYEYDANQNLIRISNALGAKSQFQYDALDRNTKILDPNGHTTQMVLDAVGNLTQVQLPAGQVSMYTYDGMGNRLTFTDATGQTTAYLYNGLGQTTQLTDPLNHTTGYAYDPSGQVNQTTDANGNQTRYSYDALGRLVAVTDPLGHVTRYRYDAVGNLISEADANLNSTSYNYDLLGRLITETNPLNQTYQYSYDPEGNLLARTDANGQFTAYGYDAANRLKTIQYPDPVQNVAYTYDSNGNLLQMADALGSTRFEYDAINRLTKQVDPWGSTFQHTYDPAGNQTGLTYPDNRKVSYAYDANNWLTQMTDPFGGTTKYQYDANGLLKRVDQPNQTWASYSYDAAGQLIQLTNGLTGQVAPLVSFGYTLDAAGNRTKAVEQYTENGQPVIINRLYNYNPRSELLKETEVRGSLAGIGVTTSYSYDPVGNRLSMTTDRGAAGGQPTSTAYTYDQANRLLQAGAVTYTYDANGNRVTRQSPGQLEQYQYDFENQMSVYMHSAGASLLAQVTNQYDGLGRRLVKNSQSAAGSSSLRYGVQGQGYQQLTEWSSSGATQLYRGLGGQLLSLAELPTGQPVQRFWFGADGLGSTATITGVNGQNAAFNSYDAFGQRLNLDGSLANVSSTSARSRYSYSGKEIDPESGLSYFGARFYDAQAGVWISADPYRGQAMDPASRHGYLYARNNPVNRVDPDGRFDYRSGAVQWGDTWESIATQWNTSVSQLRSLNPWVSTPQVGDYLQLPDCRSAECQLQLGIREVRIAGMSGTECAQRIVAQQIAYQKWYAEQRRQAALRAQQQETLQQLRELYELFRDKFNTFAEFLNKFSASKPDSVVDYIVGEMNTNASSDYVKQIRKTNETCYYCQAWDEYNKMSFLQKAFLVDENYFSDAMALDMANKSTALTLFGARVCDGKVAAITGNMVCDWDHKPYIKAHYNDLEIEGNDWDMYQKVNDTYYRVDIWSNIHYGYVGRASGFTPDELLDGAAFENKISGVLREGNLSSLSKDDDPSDKAAIKIGIQLYDDPTRQRRDVTDDDLINLIEKDSELVTRPVEK